MRRRRAQTLFFLSLLIVAAALFAALYHYDSSVIGEFRTPTGQQGVQPAEPAVQPPHEIMTGTNERVVYVYGAGLVTRKDSTGTTYQHQDYLSSNRFATDSTGKLVSRQVQEPYGTTFDETGTGGALQNDYTFTGKEQDDRLYYFGARYYDPRTGRFMSVDPIQNPATSPYSYAASNPLKFVDPTGSQAETADPLSEEWQRAFVERETAELPELRSSRRLERIERYREWELSHPPLSAVEIEQQRGSGLAKQILASAATAVVSPDITIHEGTHALAAFALGIDVTSFKPYPHRVGGMLVSGAVYYSNEQPLSRTQEAIVTIAPYVMNIGVSLGLEQLAHSVAHSQQKTALDYALPFYAGQQVLSGPLSFMQNALPGGDIDKFSRATGIPPGYVIAAGTAINAYLSYRLITEEDIWRLGFHKRF